MLDKDNLLVIILTIPLIENNLMNMHKIYPIPTFDYNVAKFFNMDSNYLISDLAIEKVIALNNEDLKTSCCKINHTYYCKDLNIFQTNKNICEIKILSNQFEQVKNVCNEQFIKIMGPIFIKTSTENRYLVFSPSPKIGKLISKNNIEILQFSNAQMLEVNYSAKLYVDDLEIKFKEQNLKTETHFNLTFDFNFNWKVDTLQNFNFSIPTVNKTILNNIELLNLSENVTNLKQLSLLRQHEKNKHNTIWIYFYIIFGLITILTFTFLIIIILHKYKIKIIWNKQLKNNNTDEPRTASI